MKHFMQILIKTWCLVFILFFGASSVFAQNAIRFVIPIVSEYSCYNGIDDDADGFIDYPLDVDCLTQNDQSEHHLTAICSPSLTSINFWQSVTWTVIPSGGSTTYTYLWSGEELNSTTSTATVTYSSLWSKNASVAVTSGVDSITVDCSDEVVVTSTSLPSDSSGGGVSSGGGFSGYAESVSSPSPILESPVTETAIPERLNSAPESDISVPKKNTPKPSPAPRVKLKTQVRLTLREDRGISLTNEPIPVPPRADNLPLFDVISELSGISMNVVNGGLLGKVAPGELLPVSVKLLNVSGTRRLDVQVYYSVFSHSNESIYSSSETVAVETTASFVKMVQIPYYIIPGVYNIKVSIKYDGQTVPATSHFPFTVEPKIGGIFRSTLVFYSLIFIASGILFLFVFVFIRKKLHRASRSSPIDYADIPSPERTFYEITSDIIMDMRQRVWDEAILIANTIEGLDIDVDSGRVISLGKNPSKIIAALVSKYEIELGKKVSLLFRQKTKK